MAANTSTVSTKQQARVSFRALGSVARHAGSGIAAWFDRLATAGQLGPDRERELGRHSGART